MTDPLPPSDEELARLRQIIRDAEVEMVETGRSFPILDLAKMGARGSEVYEAWREAEFGMRPEKRQELATRAAELRRDAKRARALAGMMDNRGKDESAKRQTQRAVELEQEAARIEKKFGFTREESVMSETNASDLVGDLVGTPSSNPQEQSTQSPKKEGAVSKPKPKPKTEKKLRAKKEAAPRKDPTILLKNPEIKRRADGSIITITGTCTWKGCTKTRTIHAADAFQVRFCKDHKKDAAKEARKAKAKKK